MQEILQGHINEVTNNIVSCTVMYVSEHGIHPTKEVLPLEFFSWIPKEKDKFNMLISKNNLGQRVLERIICTNPTEIVDEEREQILRELHDLEKDKWTIEEVDQYIDKVMSEIYEEVSNKNA